MAKNGKSSGMETKSASETKGNQDLKSSLDNVNINITVNGTECVEQTFQSVYTSTKINQDALKRKDASEKSRSGISKWKTMLLRNTGTGYQIQSLACLCGNPTWAANTERARCSLPSLNNQVRHIQVKAMNSWRQLPYFPHLLTAEYGNEEHFPIVLKSESWWGYFFLTGIKYGRTKK